MKLTFKERNLELSRTYSIFDKNRFTIYTHGHDKIALSNWKNAVPLSLMS